METSCITSLAALCSLPQPPGACEGGAHWAGRRQSTSIPTGWCHTQPAIAEWRARPGGGSSHRGAGVGKIHSRPEGRDLHRSIPEPSCLCEEEKIATVHSREKREERKKENVFFFLFVSKKIQATKDDIEKLKTGLDEFCYFQTQKQDCGALLYLHVLLSQHLAQRCNTT